MKVLITGAQGQVARGVRKGLAGRHSLRLMDIVPIQDPEGEAIRGSVANRRQVRRAVKGMDAIVHLAMRPHFNALAFDVSVKGTYILLEEALAEGVKKAVCTSTLSVYCGPSSHPFGAPETNGVTEDAPLVPDYWGYKMMKIFEEHVVRHFACEMGLPTVILRLTLPTAAEDWDAMAAAGTGSQQMTHLEDVAQAYRLALEKDGLGFDIFHIGPVDRDGRLPIDKAKRILGYEPKWSF
ncbi:MAG: NAD(P)-dependent oxidoreductase [Candidatus Brocadiia bacterium]|nr:NAD(P)-dependent oxidoreductase [Candidatus Brocadiia bacterium]